MANTNYYKTHVEPYVRGELERIHGILSFRLKPGNMERSMERLHKRWAELLPGSAFDYHFMDETLQRIYTDELRLGKAASTATVLAIIIVFLGVVGLLSLSLQKRAKEMAIRKVVGAGVPGIIRLFVREYLPVLLIAGVVASGPAYWLLQRWLNGYATRIGITPWPFVAAIGGLAVMTILLIVAQTLRAALANPVEALRSE